METKPQEQRLVDLFVGMDNDELLELTDFTMTNMVGKVSREKFAEKEKNNPDQELIARLQKEEDELRNEKRKILFSDDEEAMRDCIRKYSPILRAMVSRDEN